MTLDEVRAVALDLPEVTEAPHFDLGSFRFRGKNVLATFAPDEPDHLRVFVDESEIKAAVAEDPEAFEELWWGKQLSGLRIDLRRATPDRVAELLEEAWRRRAPKKLIQARDATPT